MDISGSITLLGIVQALFIAVLLFFKKNINYKANRILGGFFLLVALILSHFLLHRFDLFVKYPHLSKTLPPLLFLVGPLFYFYVHFLMHKGAKFSAGNLKHFFPFFVVILYNIPFYIRSADEKLKYMRWVRAEYSAAYEVFFFSILQILHIFIYVYIISRSLRIYQKELKDNMSDIEKINLNWIKNLLYFIAGIFGTVLLFYVLKIFRFNVHDIFNIIIPVFITITIFIIGFLGLIQPEVNSFEEDNSTIKKYENSNLSKEKEEAKLIELKEAMKEIKPYLDNNLTLVKLSELIDISPHHLSQIINGNFKQNFFDFINSFRVEEAKEKLVSEEYAKLTIYAIALESGFNSKSSFNNAFKKFVNLTPSEFRRNYDFINQKTGTTL